MKRSFLLFILIITISCREPELAITSNFLSQEIAIDGDATEWIQDLRFNEKTNLGYSIRNDEHFLYLCIKSDQKIFQQVMRTGLTVWFDSTAKGQKILGIYYPIGMQNTDFRGMPESVPNEGGSLDFDKRRANMLAEMEIIGPEKDDRNRVPAQNTFGIQAAIGGLPDEPVYELKIPLMQTDGRPYALDAPAGSIISLGFESDKSKRTEMTGMGMRRGGMRPGGGGEEPGGMGPGGMGPGGMGPGGGRRGGMGRGDRSRPDTEGRWPAESEPIKLWLKVQLAKGA